MSLNVIDKYVEKKKKDLFEYAKILAEIICIDDNKLWKNKEEFKSLAKAVIEKYASVYYFENNANRDNPIKYSNDNINNVLKSIIEYYKTNNNMTVLRTNKNEVFLLSVIICTSCYLDFACNVVDGDFIDTKNKFKYLLLYLKKTNILKVYNNDKVTINELFEQIKKNIKEDEKAFGYFKDTDCMNKYYLYTGEPLYYKFDFKKTISGLEEYDTSLVLEVAKKYEAKFLEISYELLTADILMELVSNRDMINYLVPVNSILKKKKNLLKIFDNSYIKGYMKLLVNTKEEAEYNDLLNDARKMGIKIIYEYDEVDNVNADIFTYDMEIIVKQEFIDNNKENAYEWQKNNIKFVIKNKED